ncbi:SDR family oxidoreductase [Pseudoalteromonas sp. KAN5]|uniref:UDP-glucose 4-epimerase family protein n=1 Tax=Pseudoalteromonas sp. KAN5 TaxID=2916633 RepID=UPI001FCA6D2C|nr:SDR family oxidoreductase [Pseudoalteromonas sp. KAN5]BDF95558.1 UDP-glucose 4-epimerase [Pseudoalteromonas sp. KAN5]
MKNILLTGATGFVGKNLFITLNNNFNVALVFRSSTEYFECANRKYKVSDFSAETDFTRCLNEIDCVIHLAARAHIQGKKSETALDEFRKSNVFATLKLAEQAAKSGVKRFIFISSIGVNGVSNSTPFIYSDDPNPTEDYAVSKYEAEIGLKKITKKTGMEVVIIRPPLVYGKGAPGNVGTLLQVAEKNLPLPLGLINNQRSFVAIDNLVDLIVTCIDHPDAANQTFLVSDDETISTSNLLKKLTLAAGKQPWLLPVPVSLLKLAASVFGKKAAVERFSSSLTVDIEHTKKTLNWKPPITLDEGIRRCFK